MPTAEQTKTYEFYSKSRNQRLVRRPTLFTETAVGTRILAQQGVRYEFLDGRLTIREGQDRIADGPLGEDGQPTLQDAYAWLTRGFLHVDGSYGPHPLLNVTLWEDGNEPDRPRPTEDEFLEVVNDALAAMSAESLVTLDVLLAKERATHNRPVLVRAAERALTTVAAVRAEMAEEPEAESPEGE